MFSINVGQIGVTKYTRVTVYGKRKKTMKKFII